MSVIGPVATAMATPFGADGSLDLDGAARLARHLVDNGTDTVVVHGTTGESPTLKTEEIWPLLECVIEAVGDDGNVMCGTGNNDTRSSIALTERATEVGADAMLVVTPYYNKPSQRMLIQHFTAIAGATDKPVVLYDIKGRTATEIDAATQLHLFEHVDNIVAVKDANGDLAKAAGMIGASGGEYEIYSGSDELNLPFLAIGAKGFVSVLSHLAGNELAEMARLFESDPVKARDIHLRLLPAVTALFAEPSPAPLKGALNRLGLPGGSVRGPILDALPETVDALLDALASGGVDLSNVKGA